MNRVVDDYAKRNCRDGHGGNVEPDSDQAHNAHRKHYRKDVGQNHEQQRFHAPEQNSDRSENENESQSET